MRGPTWGRALSALTVALICFSVPDNLTDKPLKTCLYVYSVSNLHQIRL